MFSEFRLLFFLFACISMGVINAKIELDISDGKQPLILAFTKDGQHFIALPPTTDPDNSNKLIFELEDHQLFSACPSLDPENYEMGILVLNENSVTTCEKPLKPSTMYEGSIKCGADGTGNYYKVGYMGMVQDVWLYDLCYSPAYGTFFAMHELHPGKNLKSFEEWKIDNKDYKISSEFAVKRKSENFNGLEIQLVSFDNVIAMPWKISTLFDFNFYPSNQRISESWEKMNEFLREVVNENFIRLDVFNGVKNYSNQIQHHSSAITHATYYYWKVIQCQTEGIALIIADGIPRTYTPPCKSICGEINLQELEKEIPDLLCCEVTDSLTEMFDIIMHSEEGPVGLHLKIEKVMEFNDTAFNLDIFKIGKQFYHSIMSLFKTKKD